MKSLVIFTAVFVLFVLILVTLYSFVKETIENWEEIKKKWEERITIGLFVIGLIMFFVIMLTIVIGTNRHENVFIQISNILLPQLNHVTNHIWLTVIFTFISLLFSIFGGWLIWKHLGYIILSLIVNSIEIDGKSNYILLTTRIKAVLAKLFLMLLGIKNLKSNQDTYLLVEDEKEFFLILLKLKRLKVIKLHIF